MTDLPDAQITVNEVVIGGERLPGVSEIGGVHVSPGGCRDVNKLTVTFLVGKVSVEDPSE